MKRTGTYLLAIAIAATTACAIDSGSDDTNVDVSTRAVETGAVYKLVRRGSDKCLDVYANSNSNGANILQWTCNGTSAQSFRVEAAGSAYRLVKEGTNMCVDVASAGTADGTNVQLWSCNGTAAQSFRIEDQGGGYARLVNSNSNKCLDVEGAGNGDGVNVRIWSCSSSNAQRWRLDRIGGGPSPDPQWRRANLTWFTSYPDPDSDECRYYNGCTWAGYFAFVDGKQTEQWVASHNIIAVHSRDAGAYALKTLRLRQNGRTIDATVYDMCSDSDCSGCCTRNASETGFLIDVESYTRDRFGSGSGIVEWMCLDCN